MQTRYGTCAILFVVATGLHTFFIEPAQATLKFYYDPATGNVSFDTSETRTGELFLYGFGLNSYYFEYHNLPVPARLRPENHIHLSTSTLYISDDEEISEGTLVEPWRGLYTIGAILPPALSEEFWTTAFVESSLLDYRSSHEEWLEKMRTIPYTYFYNDAIGMGDPPPADFIYGPPEGEFDNKWDLVDPDTLQWAKAATLIYRAWNGEVLIDTTGGSGGYISSFTLQSDNSFLPDGFTPIVESPFNSASVGNVYHFADALEPGRYSIGKILATGLTRNEFEAAFTEAKFLGRAGFKGGSFDFDTDGLAMTLQFVPEPASIALPCAGIVGLITLRGRRRGSR